MDEAPDQLTLSDEMLDRGAAMLPDLERSTNEVDRRLVERIIRAAFEGVPLTNYGVGLCLQAVDMVALIKTTPDNPGLLLCAVQDDPNGFDTLPHETRWQFGEDGLRSLIVSKIGVEGGDAA